MRVVPLDPAIEDSFPKFLRRDAISNYFALLDLKFSRNKTKFWIATEGAEILGYLLEYEGKIVNVRGEAGCIVELLKKLTLAEAEFFIEPSHLPIVETFYEPVRRIGPGSGKVAALLAMKVDRERFRPLIKHPPIELGMDELEDIEKLSVAFNEEMGFAPITREYTIERLRRGIFYGIYEGEELISSAFGTSGSVIEKLSHVGMVYTSPEFRGKGYATSVCSALVEKLLSQSEETMLFVLTDDFPALRVYEKIGFTKTRHSFITFLGRKIAWGSKEIALSK
jgi:ribosomal protein S18 acetylase RimI-like enzyme